MYSVPTLSISTYAEDGEGEQYQYSANNPLNRVCLDIRRHSIDSSTPLFHLLGLCRGFIEPRLKIGPPYSQAHLDGDFMLSARTMNFDGRSSLWLRNVTM